ncbi:MAG: hypothetical protein IPJ11_00990 [Gemmatimonadetes bacterium]|nr:hypothetical protein [Gemmatimonadota bacterium]
MSPTDSVEAFWSTGFVGTTLMLKVHGDTLIGTATASTDVRGGAARPDGERTSGAGGVSGGDGFDRG